VEGLREKAILLHRYIHTSSSTSPTVSSVFAAQTVAGLAKAIASKFNISRGARVKLLECQLKLIDRVLRDRLTSLLAHIESKQLAKQIVRIACHPSARTSLRCSIKTLLAELIVELALLWIRQNLVGEGDVLKGVCIAPPVWMVLQSLLLVGSFDVCLRSILVYF